jgi:hypothetical protein
VLSRLRADRGPDHSLRRRPAQRTVDHRGEA